MKHRSKSDQTVNPGMHVRGLRGATVVGALLTALALPLPSLSQDLSYRGSIQFATGDYLFTQRTNSLYFLNGIGLEVGRLNLQASLPFVTQSTPWVSYGATPIPSGGDQSGEVDSQLRRRGQMQGTGGGGTASGGDGASVIRLPTENLAYQTSIADPFIGGDVEVLPDNTRGLGVRVGGGIKLPVTDPDDGFGTGEWDYTSSISVSQRTSDRDSIFADFSYWMFGDMPDLEFKNALAYSLAYGRNFRSGRWSATASVYGLTPILENSDPPVQLGVGLTRFFDAGRSLSVNAAVGLSETVPAFSIGLGWRLGL